jgi:hypothetical protein
MLIAALALTAPDAVRAQPTTAAAPEAAPAAAESKWYEAIEVHGLADAYYGLRLDAAQTNPAEGRAFDDLNGFNLGYAELSVSSEPAPAGFRIDLGYGRAADKITPEATVDALGIGGIRFVQQAYAALKFGAVQLDVGRFVTSAGAEVIEAKDNWMYSRSFLFNNIPATHVGARATITTPVEGLTAVVGVNNGWDVVDPNSPHKTGQLAFTYGKEQTTLAGSLFVGKQPGVDDTRTLLDLIAQQGFGPLALNVNFDYFDEGDASWWGVAAMGKYTLPNDVVRLSARGEYVDDKDGFITGIADNSLIEFTGGVALAVGSSAELRLEARYDMSDEALFLGGTEDKQITGTLSALVWF